MIQCQALWRKVYREDLVYSNRGFYDEKRWIWLLWEVWSFYKNLRMIWLKYNHLCRLRESEGKGSGVITVRLSPMWLFNLIFWWVLPLWIKRHIPLVVFHKLVISFVEFIVILHSHANSLIKIWLTLEWVFISAQFLILYIVTWISHVIDWLINYL